MHLERAELLAGRAEGEVGDVIGAVAAADPAPNATMQALAGRYRAPAGWAVTSQVPFSSARKWSAVTFAGHGSWVLGAPAVIGSCLPAGIAAAVAHHEAAGRRVVLLGAAGSPADRTAPPKMITPVALLVLAERLRDDAEATVGYLLDQGITIVVLSGDAPKTVAAIAARAGIRRAVPRVTRPNWATTTPRLAAPCGRPTSSAGSGPARNSPRCGPCRRPGTSWP